ncbi:MAG: TetR/AcrR family transcriptional regulator [Sphingomonadales bacterium]|nr:TetR/AcrR family transcriptional regulator [Sphingomonadales bacterium]
MLNESAAGSVVLDTALHNQIGQKIGAKGLRTRQKLIETTIELLETHGLRDLSVADIARAASTSPATFYVYFEGVPEVLLAALEHVTQSTPELVKMAEENWSDLGDKGRPRRFVELYCAHWWRWRTVFRCRNLASEEGDGRFQEARRQSVAPLIEALTGQIMRAQSKGLVPNHLSPRASAGAILTLLERLAAVGPLTPEQPDMGFETLKDAAAYMVSALTAGR